MLFNFTRDCITDDHQFTKETRILFNQGANPYLRGELEWLNLVLVRPCILGKLHQFLLGGLVQGGFLLGGETIHLTRKHLLQGFTVLCNTLAHGVRKSCHEFGILKIVVPFQPGQVLHHLVERTEDINHRDAVPIVLRNDLGQLASTDGELVLPNSLVDPFHDTLIG